MQDVVKGTLEPNITRVRCLTIVEITRLNSCVVMVHEIPSAVVRSESGDREFAGFGRPTEDYSDSHLEASGLPLDVSR